MQEGDEIDEIFALKLTLEQSINSIRMILDEISENRKITPIMIRNMMLIYLEDLIKISESGKNLNNELEEAEAEFSKPVKLPKFQENHPGSKNRFFLPSESKHKVKVKGSKSLKSDFNPSFNSNPDLELNETFQLNKSMFNPLVQDQRRNIVIKFPKSSPLFKDSVSAEPNSMINQMIDSKPFAINQNPFKESRSEFEDFEAFPEPLKISKQKRLNFHKPTLNNEDSHLPKKRFRDRPSELPDHGLIKPAKSLEKTNKTVTPSKGFSIDELENLSFTRFNPSHMKTKEECGICLEEYTENTKVTFLNCFHKFHTSCLKECLMKKSECPVCLSEVNLD